MATRERDAESVIALLRRLMNELSTLVRQEIALASAEVSRTIRTLVASAASVAIGGLVLYAGALVLLAAAVLGLSNLVEPWLAALIVGLAVGVVGYFMVHAGLRKMP